MTQAGWITRADNYLSRVTKSRIVAAVLEAKGEKTAELLADLKKKEMAIEAERLLTGTGWLPEPLRAPAPSTTRQPQRFRPSSKTRFFRPPSKPHLHQSQRSASHHAGRCLSGSLP